MTQRLYYDNSYLLQFEAIITDMLVWHDRPGVILSGSAFYPAGGGQPHDTGYLQGVPVLDVIERETDKAVIHILAKDLPQGLLASPISGEIDWTRRFDHMQQHTGQHILSRAAEMLLDASTVGFHLGEKYCTIDLDLAPIESEQLDRLESEANRIVFENRQVTARFVSREELSQLPLRKPPQVDGSIRIVRVKDFDWSPCGGTHVRATGEVGSIKIIRTERRGSETRLEFLCGERALADYRLKNRLILDLAASLSVGYRQLSEAVERLDKEGRSQRKSLRLTREKLLDLEAESIVRQAKPLGQFSLAGRALQDRSLEEVKLLALKMSREHDCVALLGLAGEKGHLIFAAPAESPYDLRPILRQACHVIGGGGGGRPHMAQGGGTRGDLPSIQKALDLAIQIICCQE